MRGSKQRQDGKTDFLTQRRGERGIVLVVSTRGSSGGKGKSRVWEMAALYLTAKA